MSVHDLLLRVPSWFHRIATPGLYPTDQDRMRLAVRLAKENVTTRTGGPFGAAVFEKSTGRLVAGGVNLVLAMGNSVLHAEVVAIMLAEASTRSFSLGKEQGTEYELATSCEPCAMCLGAIHWSGVSRVIIGATREDVEAIGFSEGPVFQESYRYLEARGLAITREVMRDDARAVLELYAAMNGEIY